MKILVPIDGSTYSDNSLAFVASRTSLLGQNPQIELLVVLDPLPARAARLVGKDSLKRYYEEEADKIFAPARCGEKCPNLPIFPQKTGENSPFGINHILQTKKRKKDFRQFHSYPHLSTAFWEKPRKIL